MAMMPSAGAAFVSDGAARRGPNGIFATLWPAAVRESGDRCELRAINHLAFL
jgi:hypothetical protein